MNQIVQPVASAAAVRTRTVTWEDPLVFARAGATLAGIDYLRAVAQGKLPPPPIALLLGFDIEEVAEGRVVFTAATGEHQYNPIGVVHGGLAATLLDSAMGCAVHSRLPKGRGYTTLEIKVNYVRAQARQRPAARDRHRGPHGRQDRDRRGAPPRPRGPAVCPRDHDLHVVWCGGVTIANTPPRRCCRRDRAERRRNTSARSRRAVPADHDRARRP